LDLRDQLQAHLGNAFVLERELGGGGMSRVFVANELRLSRKVVVKVLSPELAQGLNAERFEREILLAASLQQANIVPVLSAGDIDGLPYFTMPFVEGESLRKRLGGAGLPIQDVVAILRDVTKALAYAHARNIVHRDIKPDNVLLSGGTAVVTDFGIAKALSASRTSGAGATLTSIGTSIGTPAYMAPEQVAGDPNIDHRVDLYSLGCMAQELLTGRAPFADRTPQKTLAAHLSESAPAVSGLRPDCPAPLAALVTQLLRKDPADRPQSANDVLHALDELSTTSNQTLSLSAPGMLPKVLGLYAVALGAVAIVAKAAVVGIGLPEWVFPGAVVVMLLGLPALLFTAYAKRVARHNAIATPTLTPGGTMNAQRPSGTMATIALKASPHLSWRRSVRAGMFAMAAFVLLVAGFMAMRALGIGSAGSLFAKGQLSRDDRIVLADFTVAPEDSALAPILAAAVRAAMSQSKSVRLMDQSDIAQTLSQMQRERGKALTPDLAREVAERANAKAVLGGRLARVGSAGYVVSLELISADRGVSLAAFQSTADGAKDLLAAVDRLTRDLRGKIGESLRQVQHSIPLEQATTSSLVALRKYSEASVANDVDGDYDRSVRLLREAVAIDSTFALAWRKMAVALNNGAGSIETRDTALRNAFRYADKLPDREKYLAIGVYYAHSLTAEDRGKSLAAYQSAFAADSSGPIAANNLASIYETRSQFDSAVRYRRREVAATNSAASASYLATTLAYAGKSDDASRILDSLHKAAPQSDNFDGVLFARYLTHLARGQGDSVESLLTTQRASTSPPVRVSGLGLTGDRRLAAGRIKEAIASYDAVMSVLASRGAGQQFDGMTTAFADITFLARPGEGVQRLDEIVAGRQWSSASPSVRPYLQIGTRYAIAGRPDRARDMLARFDAERPSARAPASQASRTELQAEIALAERKFDESIRLFRAASIAEDGAPVICVSCVEYNLGRAFAAAGKPDSAIAHFTAYVALPAVQRLDIDSRALAEVEKRLGELYDSRNDRANAIKYYGAFVEQWKNADAELQPVVATVRKRLTDLRAQEH
jgi:tetratricopeptide (TPR) repeat protein